MIRVAIDIQDGEVSAVLRRLQKGMQHLEPVLASVGQEMESRVSARFETETDPLGHPWEPWAESTRENYPDDGHGRILDRYSAMLRSLNHQVDAESVRIGFGAVASKAGDVYAVYHEYGTRFMPRRGLLTADPETGQLAPDDEVAVLDILDVWLSDLITPGA